MDPSFRIRPCTDVEEACHYFLKWPVREGWNHSPDDQEIRQAFYPSDPNGFLVGTVRDKETGKETVVCTVIAMRHNDDVAFLGCFIVDNAHRGKGYGTVLFKHALKRLETCRFVGLESMYPMVPRYQKIGFDIGWTSTTLRGDMIENVLNKISKVDGQDISIVDLTERAKIDSSLGQQLAAVENKYTGMDRPVFWKNWLTLHTSKDAAQHGRHAVAVLDADGNVAHIGFIRPAVLGFVTTLFCSDAHIASTLLRHLVQWVIDSTSSPSWALPKNHDLTVDANACSANPTALALYEDLGFKVASGRKRMWLSGLSPKSDHSGIYGVGSLTVG
ncbi:uncharacterized protein BX664DRAFT_141711 [Halteromyces radiatus]|uniref:uncharacterized protein n=1 Tax=Halteromyces radiatus TaxID=101107 RepID=UPI00221FCCCC|nr:uncharacterized protein BX664DRAFT_141711 [Halteromyces radiatus]KAI8089798.1 hypothetical protein BX664DRAFT_141711 [Halteromyces radiatus]